MELNDDDSFHDVEEDEYEDPSLVLRLSPFLQRWDFYAHHSLKEMHKRQNELKKKVNELDVTQYLDKVESGSWITISPCGRIFANTRSCDARRVVSDRDVSYIFIIV